MVDHIISIAQEVLPFLGAGFAFLWGATKLYKRKAAFYVNLILAGIGCFALGKLFGAVSFLTAGGLPEHFHVGYLGTIGCYLFIFSANYGQMDSLIDDGNKSMGRYRVMSLGGPLLIIAIVLPALFSAATLEMKIITTIMIIPVALASYYNVKHAIFPDMGIGFVKAIRPYNICAFVTAIMCAIAQMSEVMKLNTLELAADIITAGLCIVMIMSAERGTKLWTT